MPEACVTAVTDEEFEAAVLRHPGTVLVDFHTAWCPPCRQVAPTVEQLCREGKPGFKVLKMDASENPITAAAHHVSALPTFLLFHAGKKKGQFSGVQTKAQFEKWMTAALEARSR